MIDRSNERARRRHNRRVEERLEELCEMQSIPLVLGRETRLKTEDYTALLLAVRSEIASR